MQVEERFFQTQFSVFRNKLDEWNINGLSKQVLNKINHMSMVANAYVIYIYIYIYLITS